MKTTPFVPLLQGLLFSTLLLFTTPGYTQQDISGEALVGALRQGGFVIVMRHANSPRQAPDAASANPDNVNRERQLDEQGRRDAIAFGEAVRRLGIDISEVASSPTYRALETARLAGLEQVAEHEELSNENMGPNRDARTAWLLAQVAEEVVSGNRLLITHAPNVSAAFPDDSEGMDEGEALIIDPRGMEGPVLVTRIKIEAWPGL